MFSSGSIALERANVPHFGGAMSFNDSLGTTLVREGLISAEDYEKAITDQAASGWMKS